MKKPSKDLARDLNKSRLRNGIQKKGSLNRRLLIDEDRTSADGSKINWMFHATKGWRRRRVSGDAT